MNAPGTANRTTFLPPNSSSLDTSPGPLSVMWASFTLGTLSPTLIVIVPCSLDYWLKMMMG